MRLGFAISVGLLLAVSIWAVWAELRPEWRRHQETLFARAEERLEAELDQARQTFERPEVQDRLATIDRRLSKIAADTTETATRRTEIQSRLAEIRTETARLRSRLRRGDTPLDTGGRAPLSGRAVAPRRRSKRLQRCERQMATGRGGG